MTTLRNWLLAAVLLALMSLSVGCGSDPALEAQAAQPRTETEYPRPPAPGDDLVAVREVCSVVLLEDGSVQCTCVTVQQ